MVTIQKPVETFREGGEEKAGCETGITYSLEFFKMAKRIIMLSF